MGSIFLKHDEEPGALKPPVSLAGIEGQTGKGLEVANSGDQAVTTAIVIGANGQRAWMLITIRHDSTDDAIVTFGGVADSGGIRVRPGGSLQIDKNLPWTGAMVLAPASGTINVNIIEASVI